MTATYVARKPCGCICCAIFGDPALERSTAEALMEWRQAGLGVEQSTPETVRQEFVGWNCPHEPKQMRLFEPPVADEDTTRCEVQNAI